MVIGPWPITVYINHTPFDITQPFLSFEDIVEMAGYPSGTILTVTYHDCVCDGVIVGPDGGVDCRHLATITATLTDFA